MSVAGNMLAEQFRNRKKVEFKKKFRKGEKNTNGIKKTKQKKRKRLIIRNLSFKVDETELKKVFSEFGNVVEVKIPLKKDGKKKGFGFVEFDNTKSLIQAMKSTNYKEIKGRKVAVDFAVDKTTYQLKVQSMKQDSKASVKDESELDTTKIKSDVMSEDEDENEKEEEEDENEEEEEEDEKRLNAFLKEFDSGADALTRSKSLQQDDASSDSSDESSSDESEDDEENSETDRKQKRKFDGRQDSPSKKPKKDSDDISEGKTVFIRNIAFTSTEDSLKEALEKYGESVYCLLCMDQYTDYPKGTAFIKFKEKSSATRLVEESFNEPGVVVDGRPLSCSLAISRKELTRLGDASKKPKDKRNLNLLRVGLIMANSKESEGVSPSDMARRAQLEITKKMKLRNVNFFVSDTRLMIHNLPKVFSDVELRKIFKNAVGPGAVITEARIMKEFKKTDAEGKPVNKGYGFVTFTKHEDALTAVKKLNNNPDTFTSQKRPIVEFVVENRVAIQSKKRKQEKTQMRNKRRTEEKRGRQLKEDAEKHTQKETPMKKKKQKYVQNKTDEKKLENKQKNNQVMDSQITKADENGPKGKQKKKGKSNKERREKKKANVKARQADVSDLVNKYKDKLQNKIT